MEISSFKKPFSHIIISDYYTKEEYDLIWNELVYLQPRMRHPQETNAAMRDGVHLKRGRGIYVDNLFVERNMSEVFNITRKIMSTNEILEIADSKLDTYFKLFKHIDTDSTLVQLYTDGDYYHAHNDSSVFTTTSVLHKTPKPYSGGEFYFPDFDYTVDLTDNQTLIFPSILLHQIREVTLNTDDPMDGRFSISQLMRVFVNR